MISFVVPGVPVSQPRQRHAIIAGKLRNYTPQNHPVQSFKAAVRLCASAANAGKPPATGPLLVECIFVFPRPKGKRWKNKPMVREYKSVKPDCDNITKALLDSCKGILWVDDAQIAVLNTSKFIASGDEQPHTEITVQELA